MIRRWLLCGLVLSAASAAAFAQDAPAVDCETASDQMSLNICASQDLDVADKALNAAYRQTLKRAEASDGNLAEASPNLVGAVAALKTAQRAWIVYRDAQCTLAGFEARGGTMEPMLVSGCLADLTRQRTEDLDGALKDP